MPDPWRWCTADDDMVADFLAASVETVIDLGGWIHPAARFVAAGGELHVECDGDDGEPLLRLPREAFLRLHRIDWSTDGEHLAIESMAEDAGDPSLLMAQVGLHNSCGKMMHLATNHPVLAPDMSEELVTAVRAFRPSFRLRQPDAVSLFWSNRAFRIPAYAPLPEPVALPLIDLLNHHPDGAVGQWDGECFAVDVRHPTGTSECLIDYGLQRDAVGMAVVYGFVDAANPMAHSAPLHCVVDDTVITVSARGRSRDGLLLPPVVQYDGNAWTISHLTFGALDPRQDLAGASGQGPGWCGQVLRAIADANLDLIESGIRAAGLTPTSKAGLIVEGALRRQRALIAAYFE